MTYKHARTLSELQEESRDYTELYSRRPYLLIEEWNVEDIDADVTLLGLSGSPTKVKKIENVVFQQKESNVITDSDEDIGNMMKQLIDSHVIG
jgi:electron transfer flavoprotein beta subunit